MNLDYKMVKKGKGDICLSVSLQQHSKGDKLINVNKRGLTHFRSHTSDYFYLCRQRGRAQNILIISLQPIHTVLAELFKYWSKMHLCLKLKVLKYCYFSNF